MKTKKKELKQQFQKLGITRGDHLLVHSSFSALGKIEGGPKTVIQVLKEIIGNEGTLVLPSFNWDYFKASEKIIDLANTPSKMGVISEIFRTMEGVRRTRNLFHPLCVYGHFQKALLKCDAYDTWGEKSPYGFMYHNRFKILLMGVDLNRCSVMHYCEQKAGVWYRKPIIYDGYTVDENGEKKSCRCRRLILKGRLEPDLNKGKTSLTEDNCQTKVVGNAICRLIDISKFVDRVIKNFELDRNYLLKTEELGTAMPTMGEEINFSPLKLISDLHLTNRALVSDGFDEALDYIGRIIPLKIRKFKTGTKVQTWRIPQKWLLKEGFIKKNGKRIVDTKNQPLHVWTNSQPFEGVISKAEMLEHITTDPKRPDVIPYKFVYYQSEWGFSIKHKDLKLFDAESYRIKIDAELTEGYLSVGEIEKKGLSDKIILLPIHLDHPGQCNDNLSGVSVAVALALCLKRGQSTRYSYRILFVPESIGTLAYIDHYKSLLKNVECGIVFDSIGHSNRMYLMKTLGGNSRIDRIATHVMKYRYKDAAIYPFLDSAISCFCNDERILQSPGFEIPAIALGRAPFPYYHSSGDTPDKIFEKNLQDTLELILEIINIYESNYIPLRKFDGVPFLSGYRLWRDDWTSEEQLSIEKVHYHLNDSYSIFEIAERIDMPYNFVLNYLEPLIQKKLIQKKECI